MVTVTSSRTRFSEETLDFSPWMEFSDIVWEGNRSKKNVRKKVFPVQ